MFGKHLSEEVKLRISESLKGKTHSEETKSKMSEAQRKVDRTGEKPLTLVKLIQLRLKQKWVLLEEFLFLYIQ